jgi:ADP-ribose pyrophosphatase YjhB (NUDIX family)
MKVKDIEDRTREYCPDCGWIYYEQIKVAAGMIIERNGRLLLLQRGHEPWRGYWNIPAGYSEVDEPPIRTAERETFEETGLHVRARQLLEAYFFDDDPRGNGLVLIFDGEVIGGELSSSGESVDMGFFGVDELPEQLAGGAHNVIVYDWAKGRFSNIDIGK